MQVFGLTGGIASGKSEVARLLRARGVPVVDADAIAREVVAPGTSGLAALVDAFGASILLPDGSLDRKALGARVFTDDVARRTLNAITHPRISTRTTERIAELQASHDPLGAYDAALLVENGVHALFRPLVVVAASEPLQIARCMARDGLTEDEARARVRSQMPLAKKIAVADFVIENDGTLAELEAEVDATLQAIRERLGGDGSR